LLLNNRRLKISTPRVFNIMATITIFKGIGINVNEFIYSHLSDWVSENNTSLGNRLDNPERRYFPLPEVGRLISVRQL